MPSTTDTPMPICRVVLLVLAVGLALPSAALSAPRDKLLRLVPDDLALCLIVDNLRDQADRFWKSETVARFRQSPWGRSLFEAGEMQDLHKLNTELKQHFKIDWTKLQNDVLGDCVVFAFHPGTAGGKNEKGMLLIWAKDDKLLTRLIKTVNQAQRQSGELQALVPKKYKGVTYHRRLEAKREEQFYFQKEHLFAYSNREAVLKSIIDRYSASESLVDPSALQRSLQRLPERDSLLTFWINPRAFDGEFEKKSQSGNAAEKQVLQTLALYWKALDAAAITLAIQPNPSLALTLQCRAKDLPAAARKLLSRAGPSTDLWGRFPADSAVCIAGRLDFSLLLETLEEFATPPKRKGLRTTLQNKIGALMGGRDFIKGVLAHLGPDVGLCVSPAPAGNETPHALFALRVQPGPAGDPVDQALWNTLNGLLIGAAAAHNATSKHPIVVKSLRRGKVRIRYLTHPDFPKGFAPGIALKSGYLLFASSPDAVARFKAKPLAVTNPPLLRISFREITGMLKKHRRWVLQTWEKNNGMSPQAAKQLLDNLAAARLILDRLEIDHRSEDGQATLRMRLIAAK